MTSSLQRQRESSLENLELFTPGRKKRTISFFLFGFVCLYLCLMFCCPDVARRVLALENVNLMLFFSKKKRKGKKKKPAHD